MREILFRGKRIDNGEWVVGLPLETSIKDYVEYGSSFYIVRGYAERNIDGWRFISNLVDPETVGQYTGLTDKNGKKIFEGDIISCRSFSGINDFEKSLVCWCDLLLCFRADKHSLFGDFQQDYEIIGNIHDNPELLKGGVTECPKISK